jgi:hypothetical protein
VRAQLHTAAQRAATGPAAQHLAAAHHTAAACEELAAWGTACQSAITNCSIWIDESLT